MYAAYDEEPAALMNRKAINMPTFTDSAQIRLPTADTKNEIR